MPYRYRPVSYTHLDVYKRQVLEDGLWKLQGIHWKPILEFGHWTAKDATKLYGRPYPKPFEQLSAIDDATASEATVAACNVRNQVLAFFHDFNHIGLSAIDGRFGPDAAREALSLIHIFIRCRTRS